MQAPAGFTKTKRAALLYAGFLGAFGGHRFYLGYPKSGFAMLLLSLVGVFTFGLTLPLVVLWILLDVAAIAFGVFSDSDGYPLS